MKTAKKYLFAFLSLIIPATAIAAPIECVLEKECAKSIEGLLGRLVTYLYTAFYIVAVGFILLAAFNYLQGGTNPEKIKAAKSQLKYAVIAITIALIASGMSLIISSVLGLV
jgi:hypothetical protein